MIAEIFFEEALTANGLLEALLAIALPEPDVHAAGSDPGFDDSPGVVGWWPLLLMRWKRA